MKTTTAFVLSHSSERHGMAKVPVLNIAALTMTRALGRERIKVVRVQPNSSDDGLCSRYLHGVEHCPELRNSESALLNFLLGLGSRYPGEKVLLPASEECARFIAQHEKGLSTNFVLLNPTAATLESTGDRRCQYELANNVGVPIPETYFPQSVNDIVGIARQLDDFPYIIKPVAASLFRAKSHAETAGSEKAIVVHTRQELIDQYTQVSAQGRKVMVQEIIAGKDDQLITFLGYCSPRHKPLAHCIRSKIRQAPIDFGYCTATVSCHNDVIERYAKRLLNQADYTGIVAIEFKFDPRINDYKLIEINSRPVDTIGLAEACGVNLPLIAYRDVLGEGQDPVTNWEDGVIWLRLAQDIATARELRRHGRLKAADWFRSIRGRRVHAILAMDDPWPFLKFYTRLCVSQLNERVRSTDIPFLSRGTRRWLERVSTWMF